MDALLPAFVAAFAAEWGDKTQLLTMALAARFNRFVPLLAGIALAAIANCIAAAVGGAFVQALIVPRAATLVLALALLYAGGAALFRHRAPKLDAWKTGAFLTALTGFFLYEFGDKTQFLAFGLAARSSEPALVSVGAAAGVIAASVPALFMGERLAQVVPLLTIKRVVGTSFLLLGLWAAVTALRLA